MLGIEKYKIWFINNNVSNSKLFNFWITFYLYLTKLKSVLLDIDICNDQGWGQVHICILILIKNACFPVVICRMSLRAPLPTVTLYPLSSNRADHCDNTCYVITRQTQGMDIFF